MMNAMLQYGDHTFTGLRGVVTWAQPLWAVCALPMTLCVVGCVCDVGVVFVGTVVGVVWLLVDG